MTLVFVLFILFIASPAVASTPVVMCADRACMNKLLAAKAPGATGADAPEPASAAAIARCESGGYGIAVVDGDVNRAEQITCLPIWQEGAANGME